MRGEKPLFISSGICYQWGASGEVMHSISLREDRELRILDKTLPRRPLSAWDLNRPGPGCPQARLMITARNRPLARLELYGLA